MAQQEVAKGCGENVTFGTPTVSSSEQRNYPITSDTIIQVESKEKKRGVFRVPVYIATLKTKVSFNKSRVQKNQSSKDKKTPELEYLTLRVRPVDTPYLRRRAIFARDE